MVDRSNARLRNVIRLCLTKLISACSRPAALTVWILVKLSIMTLETVDFASHAALLSGSTREIVQRISAA